MKARAWLLTLLIGLISFAGFGQTTTDPAENSTSQNIIQENDDFDSVVISLDVEENRFAETCLEANRSFSKVHQKDLILLKRGIENTIEKIKIPDQGQIQKENFKPETLKRKYNSIKISEKDPPKYLTHFRKPRDGIRQDRVFFFHI